MTSETLFSLGDRARRLSELALPLELDGLAGGAGPWEVEIGFGKGRYLLRRAGERPGQRFLGIEREGKYFRLAAHRARRRGLENLVLIHGEALYLLSAVLPRGFAATVHVYFPDPWPKSRHQKRRLFEPETVDLVLGLLRPGGTLCFATDFIAYGELVEEILRGVPDLAVETLDCPWPDGARTNYEAKYMAEGRPILRLRATLDAVARPGELHPRAARAVLAATLKSADPAHKDPA